MQPIRVLMLLLTTVAVLGFTFYSTRLHAAVSPSKSVKSARRHVVFTRHHRQKGAGYVNARRATQAMTTTTIDRRPVLGPSAHRQSLDLRPALYQISTTGTSVRE